MAAHDAVILESLLHSRTMRRTVADELRKQGRCFEWVRKQSQAAWWIENRGLNVNGIAKVAWAEMTRRPSAG